LRPPVPRNARYTFSMSNTKKSWGIGSALSTTLNGANKFGRNLMGLHNRTFPVRRPGEQAGIELAQLSKMAAEQTDIIPSGIACVDYSREPAEIQEITNLDDFIIQHRPEWSKVRWINIDGLSDPEVLRAFAVKYDLHPLAVEDVVHAPQRPKVE